MSVLMVESELQKLVPIFGCGNSQEGALFTSATDRKAVFVSHLVKINVVPLKPLEQW